MQTTLLGLALAAIVALVTALVGPLMIDWAAWRSTFETEASRVIGMPVRIAGEIDARLLPVPSLTLRRIEAGAPDFGPSFRVRTLEVELKLGSLVRGEWRADALRLDAPEAEIGLDRAGALILPSLTMSFEPDQLAIDRLTVSGGRITLTDAASGGRLVIERASFRGEARSLIGPFKGDGVLVAAGNEYAYRASGNRLGDDGGMKLRVNLDALDRPLSIEADATLWAGEAKPRYEGSVVLSRPAGQVLSSGKAVANVPWRASGRVRGTSETALIEQVEIQYGPDDQAMKLTGSAQLRFGAKPSLDGVLSSRQIDGDRWLAPDGVRRPPVALVAAMTEAVSASPPPLPVTLGIGIDNLSFGGAMLQTVRGDLRVEDGAWNLDSLEFRAPGLTQVRASGELSTGDGAGFHGPVAVESADPRALVAWLEGRADATRAAAGSMSLRGDVTLGRTRLAIDRLQAEFDRRALDGRLSYAFAAANRPARLEADIRAAEFDLDAALAFAGNAFAGAAFERPGEVALALDFGKASYAGVEAHGAKARLSFDAGGLAIERMSIADVNGAKVEASGRIDDLSTRPRGSITLAVEAQRLDGAARLAGRLSPQASQAVQQLASRAAATRLVAKLDMGAAAAGSGAVTDARLAVDGAIGAVKIAVTAAGHGDAASPRQATISFDGRLESSDGGALAALIGVDRHAGVDHRPARLTLRTGGRLDSALTIDAAFAGAGLDATAAGKLAWTDDGAKGTLDTAMAAADIKALRRPGGAPVAIDIAGRLDVDGSKVEVTGLKGAVAGSAVGGRLTLAFGRPLSVAGAIDADRVELPALLGLALGLPAPANNRTAGWMPEPFAVAPPVEVVGEVAFSAKSATLTPALSAADVRGRLVLEPGSAHLEALEGRLAQGRLKGDARMQIGTGGATLHADVTLTDAELSRLVSTPGRPNGRITLQLQAAGSGRSPAALVGALRGGGTLTFDALQVPGLDPNAIPTSVRAADQGVSIDTIRIGDVVGAALDRGALSVPFIGGGFTIADGRASFGEVTAKAQDTSLSASGNYDLSTGMLDMRLALAGAAPGEGPADMRPRIDITLRGPLEAPRRQVDVSALVGFLTLRTVEREAKRLEAAEREAKRLQDIAREAKRRDELEAARRAREQQAREQQVREQQAREQQAREQQAREQQAREQQAREQQAREQRARDQQARELGTGSVAVSPQRGNTSTSGGPTGTAPALPPPIDILPTPTDRGGRRASPAAPSAGPPSASPETR